MRQLPIVWIALAAYLLGSVPFGYLLVRFVKGKDIRATGSGNIGATNVIRSGARGLGVATLLLDMLKGYWAVALSFALARHFGVSSWAGAAALGGLFAVLGHIFPVWLGFRGGKGVATAFGVVAALAPFPALVSLGVFAGVFFLTRFVSLSSLAATIALPVLVLLVPPPAATATLKWVVVALAALILVKHRENIVRLIRGTEYRFGRDRAAGA